MYNDNIHNYILSSPSDLSVLNYEKMSQCGIFCGDSYYYRLSRLSYTKLNTE